MSNGALRARATAGLLGILSCCRPPEAPIQRPWNVLLVSVDTLRADYLSSYDETRHASTPHIDRLAREGVLFENVQSVAPTTLPSHASLFTGLTPPAHGVRDNVGFYLSPERETLASRLKTAGYRTAAFVGAFVLDSRFGLERGFDVYFDEFENEEEGIASSLVTQRRGREVLDPALDWLEENALREHEPPFFVFLHFYDPHAPYDPPSSEDGSLESRYRGEIAYVDKLVGEILDWLDESGQAGNTLVVLTSDHGESLGEHGEDTHGFFVYQSTLEVPLLLRYPGSPQGARVESLSSLVDVSPTILDLLNLSPLEQAQGRSLKPLVEKARDSPTTSAYSETFFPRVHFGWSELRSLRQGRYKFILAPRPELYDLQDDPDEKVNLASGDPQRVEAMKAALQRYVEARDIHTERDLDLASLERLRSLGYVGTAAAEPSSRWLADPKDRVEVYRDLIDTELSDVEPGKGTNFVESLKRLERAIEKDPAVPRAHLLYGELLLKTDQVDRAATAFERLIEIDAESFAGHYGLGVALLRAGQADAAARQFERAIAIEPENTKGYYRLAEVGMLRGDWGLAERLLRQAMERNSDRFLAERLSQVLLQSGKPEESRRILEELAASDPQDPLAAYNLAQLLLIDGEAEQALALFRRASELEPEPDAFQGIGNALVALGRLEEAVSAYRRATSLSPCFTPALSNLGSALVQMKRYEEARASLEEAIACEPRYIRAHQNLAAVFLETGEIDRAASVLRRALASNPDDPDLRSALAEIERYRMSIR